MQRSRRYRPGLSMISPLVPTHRRARRSACASGVLQIDRVPTVSNAQEFLLELRGRLQRFTACCTGHGALDIAEATCYANTPPIRSEPRR
jgi:hypothetical protein